MPTEHANRARIQARPLGATLRQRGAAELSGVSPFPLALGGEARATQRLLPVVV